MERRHGHDIGDEEHGDRPHGTKETFTNQSNGARTKHRARKNGLQRWFLWFMAVLMTGSGFLWWFQWRYWSPMTHKEQQMKASVPRTKAEDVNLRIPTQESTKTIHSNVEMPTVNEDNPSPIMHLPKTTRMHDDLDIAAPTTHASASSKQTILRGYDALISFLSQHDQESSGQPLFLFFICDRNSNDNIDNSDLMEWHQVCQQASAIVDAEFAKTSAQHLVTIEGGSYAEWQFNNAFRSDRNLRVKKLPCIMQWEGRDGRTTGMMVGDTLLDAPLLQYLFQPRSVPPDPSKRITTVESYEAYQQALTTDQISFVVFISGRIPDNNRPWCPYCRFSDLPIEYAFRSFAPSGAHLLRVEVAPTYRAWKEPDNVFRLDGALQLTGVPALYRVESGRLERQYVRLDRLESLQMLFQV